MALDVNQLMAAEKEANRILEEAQVEARWIRRGAEREAAQALEAADREGANIRQRMETEFESEAAGLREESAARIRHATAAVRVALEEHGPAAVEDVVRELTK